ncbi:metal-dependent hydrolase [Duganella sp. LX20W]|uniref:Metal-dependent hydrolase n=1 Tax=Rugamonas brunnea TaxID=2758569 RepID=A0A7W2EQZ8_9BURK|nr:metal-dependent hydrolase [Rugamonas brunnea]MBA5636874.1 metal-dependent hydrolase [Rugamonas brunnea]
MLDTTEQRQPPAAITTTMRQHIHLAPRRMAWDFSAVPACPVRDDPNLAAFLMAVSWFVVAFEDWGIVVVRNDKARLVDFPALNREAQAFLSQEALHSQGHDLFNSVMIEGHGFDVDAIERECARLKRDMAEGSQQAQLAAVAAFEHIIFSVAHWYENAPEVHRLIHPEFHRLLMWHAMEETEHTAVVHDMYLHLYGGRADAHAVRIAALRRATRIGVRSLYRMWQALLPQLAVRMGCRPARFTPWAAILRESLKYVGDYFSFLSSSFSPWNRPVSPEVLPELRKHMIPAHAPDAAQWRACKVAAIRPVAEDVCAYTLVAADGGTLPSWTAGAHLDVEIETGVVRQYSLCGDPAVRDQYQIAVKREALGRGGSLRLHQETRAGAVLRVGMPRNQFPLAGAEGAGRQAVLIAGGVGVTPLLAMAWTLHHAGVPFNLHICSRDVAHLPFAGEIADWPFAARVRAHADSAAAGGRVDVRALIPAWDAARPLELYTCGPAPFMDAVCAAATAAGWPASALHLERFTGTATVRPDDRPFTLTLQKSNITLPVAAEQTIVEAMEARGLQPKASCREGMCGACVCSVVEGEADHRDVVLTQDEQRSAHRMAICVSRARGAHLTLDL